MKNFIFLAIALSRPKFWAYLAGPYIVGYAAGVDTFSEFFSGFFILHFIYFLTIANLYVYGLNDLSDTDTDPLNTKKGTKEHLLHASEKKRVYILVLISILASIGMVSLQPTLMSKILLSIFLLLSGLYSVPPIRFKARAFFDFASNIHYAIPAFLAYNQLTGNVPSLYIWIAAFCWTGAMHIFSAIPDITPDKKSGVITTAVTLGKKRSLILCILLWIITAGVTTAHTQLFPFSLIAWTYPLYAILLLKQIEKIDSWYWYFPLINTVLGGILFFTLYFAI
jgi:4-hydroxybenzoate polyprenyltransferase